MGWAVLYIAFGCVAVWLLGEVLLQYKARLRWRLLAFFGFLGVVLGVLTQLIAVILLGAVAFGAGQLFVTLSFRSGFSTGWSLGGKPGTSRRRRAEGGEPSAPPPADAEPVLKVSQLEETASYLPQPMPDDTGQYGVYDRAEPEDAPRTAADTYGTPAAGGAWASSDPTGGTPAGGTPAYDAGTYGTASYDTGSYGTASYDTGSYDTASYDTGSYGTASYDTGSYAATGWPDQGLPGTPPDPTSQDQHSPAFGYGAAEQYLGHPGPYGDDASTQSYGDQGAQTQGYDPQGYSTPSYDNRPYDAQGYDPRSHGSQGYDTQGYNTSGYPGQGYDDQGTPSYGDQTYSGYGDQPYAGYQTPEPGYQETPPGGVWVPQQRATEEPPQPPADGQPGYYDPQQRY
ncbi:hypothetical protein GL263_13410 [Streptomyces durbertensis]|uniref:Integral membrane protein n=1 Tax=Streptomyces durbertensis TaxID=2448886 RepID=A0ABR6EGU5_9ACTN|nr:hypothetical protein [Streptomyces durbertensis]MBB1244555.1 hypothetical protein [Streptomyces durbertensis]